MLDPWIVLAGLCGAVVSAALVLLREALATRREAGVRAEERARLEGEIITTLRQHGHKLDHIQLRVDSLPCAVCEGDERKVKRKHDHRAIVAARG